MLKHSSGQASDEVRKRRLFLDAGNADIKSLDASGNRNVYPHALALLPEAKWVQAVGNASLPPQGYAEVWHGGTQYRFAYGSAALRHSLLRLRGAARYTPGYYGLMMCGAFIEHFDIGSQNAALRVMHAPQDYIFVDDLLDAVMGDWHITSHDGRMEVSVTEAYPLDEPLGGLYHLLYDDTGHEVHNRNHAGLTALVVDVGGYTVDIVPVDAGYQIDYAAMQSTRLGSLTVYRDVEDAIRRQFKAKFKGVGALHPGRLEQAVLTGYLPYGKTRLNVKAIVTDHVQELVNDIIGIIDGLGGAANYDALYLTGGGAALVMTPLKKQMAELAIMPVESNRELMRFANVSGLRKFFSMLEREGEI